MRKTAIRLLLLAAFIVAAAGGASALPDTAGSGKVPANNILAQALAAEKGQLKLSAKSPIRRLSGGTVYSLLERTGVLNQRAARASKRYRAANDNGGVYRVSRPRSEGCQNVFSGHGDSSHRGNSNDDEGDNGGVKNTRVNQDCTLRRQAEEWLGVNPRDFDNVLAGQNDSRIGFNHCGYDWSFSKGRDWGDSGTAPPPFWQLILKDAHTADACSDPAGTFDHLGNAYITGVLFDIASPASAIPVMKSNWPNGGAFYHTARPGTFQEYSTSPVTGPASDNDPNIFHDKELMVADTRAASAKKGRVYVTWTRFETNATPPGGRSPIVFSQSKDGGDTWSREVIISGSAGSFCTDFSGTPGDAAACDQDQGSHPVVGPDGTIYVIFGNGNTPSPGINQVMMVKCPATKECDTEADWTPPVRIGDLIGTHPSGPSPNGCPAGRQCLPPNGYRIPEFTSLSISADRNGNLYATWADHRNNTNPNCGIAAPGGGAPPCDHDVFYAYSTDGGTTWSPTITVTPRARLGETAQFMPWHDVAGSGKRVFVAFYDRHYGNCEFSGCNDITLATISNPRSAHPSISYKRITTSSMPNLTRANNPVQAGFIGDYMWLEVSHHNFNQSDVHMVWADTRPLPYRLAHQRAPEEDIYYARIERGNRDH
ncbi:MAG: glycoside hydrolase [Actinomycetota bacterium]|nr:glycoside hydrolase [Actinomycetota bacterium]